MCAPLLAALPALFSAAGAAGATTATAAATTAGLSTMQIVSLAASVGGALMTGMGAYNQQSAAADIAKNNAKVAEYQAKDIERRGEKEAVDLRRRADQFKGQQRVKLAANGLDLTYGSAADQLDATDFFAKQDENTVRTNTSKDAWNARAQKRQYQAEAASYSPWMAASGSLLTGAGQVADKWNSYRG